MSDNHETVAASVPTCPKCGSVRAKPNQKDDPEDGVDRWFECMDCGFKFLPEAEA